MPIRCATFADLDDWAALRARLWPATAPARHRDEARAMLARPRGEAIALLEAAGASAPRAFAEATLRRDHVNGCETSPVAFLEGIFVRPRHRGTGMGRALVAAVEAWARERGCAELASDADLANHASRRFHRAIGLQERERVVFFGNRLRDPSAPLPSRAGRATLGQTPEPERAMPPYDPQNIFARILRGEIPNDTVEETDHTLAFNDITPQAPVHVLVIPRGEYRTYDDFHARASEAEIVDFHRTCARICQRTGIDRTGFRAIANAGEDAVQEVPHFHLHLIGGRPLGRMLSPAPA